MDSPPRDDSTADSSSDRGATDPSPDREATVSPTDRTAASADDAATSADGAAATRPAAPTDGSEFDDPLGDLLPRPGVDSRWWYWIAAIPLYVAVSAVVGLLFAAVALLGLGLGVEAGVVGFGLLFVVVLGLGLAGLALTVVFPIATYVDARAVAASEASWTPDPLVWGLAALATVILSAFTLSFVLAVYYLYKRHVAVGTP